MRPFTLGITTLVQGIYTLVFFVVLFDVASPTFDLDRFPDWTGIELVIGLVVAFVASVALGVVMHTISRALFHSIKRSWSLRVLTSSTVRRRFAELRNLNEFPGGPKYSDVLDETTPRRERVAGAFTHSIEYRLMTRATGVYRTIQVYREQYRLARGFIIPSAAFAIVLPLWGPVAALDGAGAIGPFPIIRTQLFLLGVLAAAVCFVAFRERSYRYAAAKILAFVTLEAGRRTE
jgi:hypothetical protein